MDKSAAQLRVEVQVEQVRLGFLLFKDLESGGWRLGLGWKQDKPLRGRCWQRSAQSAFVPWFWWCRPSPEVGQVRRDISLRRNAMVSVAIWLHGTKVPFTIVPVLTHVQCVSKKNLLSEMGLLGANKAYLLHTLLLYVLT